MQVGSDADAGAASVVGPLNALEADRFVEDLSTIAFEDVGGHRWMHQHECLEKLNIQAHVNASQQRDEFVVEGLLLHEKLPVLVRELIVFMRQNMRVITFQSYTSRMKFTMQYFNSYTPSKH